MSFFANSSKWPLVTLRDIATLKRGYDLPTKSRVEGNVPIYAANGQNGTHNQVKIKAPGVITGRSGTIGKVHFTDVDYWPLNTALYVTDFHGNDPKWVYYMLQAFKLERFVEGAGVPTLNRNLVHGELIPLPPLDEQKRIAAILDKADAIRRKRQQAINLADDFLRSVFLDMFGDPVTNPKGWEVELLGGHIQHANNGLSRRRKVDENIGNIVLRLQDVHYEGIRYGKELNRIELEEKEKSRYRLEIGDLLFIRVNGNPEYVGRSAVFDGFGEEVFHNDHLIRIKVKDSFNSQFLSYMFNLPGGKNIISGKTKTSAGQHTISQGGIESLEFIVPPIGLQNKFVEIQSKVKKQLVKQSNSLKELTHGFNSLSQKAFAGEL